MWVDETHEGTTYFQRAGNLSAGGIYIEGTIPHQPGTKIRLRFTLPGDSKPVEVRGEVVAGTAADTGMHVRFIDLSEQPDVAEKLARLDS